MKRAEFAIAAHFDCAVFSKRELKIRFHIKLDRSIEYRVKSVERRVKNLLEVACKRIWFL